MPRAGTIQQRDRQNSQMATTGDLREAADAVNQLSSVSGHVPVVGRLDENYLAVT